MAISLNDAIAIVTTHATTLPPQIVSADVAAGRIVAQDVVSAIDLPPFENSAMDGFAVNSRDTVDSTQRATSLAITMESRAGHPSTGALAGGCAAQISTGAMLPEGADAVVRVEDATVVDGVLHLTGPVQRGENVRAAGDDVRRGSVVLQAGARLNAGELAMLAAIGLTSVPVFGQPSIAIITTGDETVPPGNPLGPGQIHESNAVMLAAQAREAGAVIERVIGGVADTLEATIATIGDALRAADIVAISGGVSMGAHDHVKPALDALGVTCEFWQVALRPGHPTWFGTIDLDGRKRLVFGLPGNPVSAYVTFHLFVATAIARMCGARRPLIELPATYSGPTRHKALGTSLGLRCRIDTGPFGVLAVLTQNDQRSHMVGSLVGADGVAIVPPGRDRIEDGDQVMVRLPRT